MGFIIELIGDLIIDGFFELMQLIIPNKMASKKLRLFLKIAVYAFSFILFISVVFGIFAVISDDEYTRNIGIYLIFIPLGISAVWIVMGLVARSIRKK